MCFLYQWFPVEVPVPTQGVASVDNSKGRELLTQNRKYFLKYCTVLALQAYKKYSKETITL